MTHPNRYQPVSKLTEHQHSTTYEAWDSLLSRPVILKTAKPKLKSGEFDRFQKKYHRLAALSHPNLLEVYDFDRSGGNFSVVIEPLTGESLKAICQDGLISEEDFDLLVEQTLCWATTWEESGSGNVIVGLGDVIVVRQANDQFQFKVCDFEIVDPPVGEKGGKAASASDLLGSLARLYIFALAGGDSAPEQSDERPGGDRLTSMKNWMRLQRPDVSQLRTDWLSRLLFQLEEQAPISARESRVLFEKSVGSGPEADDTALNHSVYREVEDEDETAPVPLHLLDGEDSEGGEVLEPLQPGKGRREAISFTPPVRYKFAPGKWIAGIGACAAAIILSAILLPTLWSGKNAGIPETGEMVAQNGLEVAPGVEEPVEEENFAATEKANEEKSSRSAERPNAEVELNPAAPELESSLMLADTGQPPVTAKPVAPANVELEPEKERKPIEPAKTQGHARVENPLVRSLKARQTPAQQAAAEIAAISELLRESADGKGIEAEERRLLVERLDVLFGLGLEKPNWPAADFDSLLPTLIGERAELEESEIALLKKSATGLNSVNAAILLATYYQANDDDVAALPWLIAAAKGENVEAMVESGLLLLSGDSSSKEQSQGFSWLNRAAELGDGDANYLIGECLLLGKGTPRNEAEAVRYLKKGTEFGDPRAFDLLGVCHADGLGVEVDFDEARILFQKAIDLGNESALANLAVLYLNGEIAEKDRDAKAVALLERGADKENLNCLFLLGQCHENGIGLEKDTTLARKLYERAATAGSKHATELLKTLSQSD